MRQFLARLALPPEKSTGWMARAITAIMRPTLGIGIVSLEIAVHR
jgi:hypothetical protein